MTHDVIVIGGSYAGMAAALQLLRARRSVLIIDAGRRRNRSASHSHGFLAQDGADPAELIRAASGWEVPVRALGCWLRGAAAGEAAFGPATIAVDGAGLPRRIEQAGWTVEYSAWTPAANDELPMPTRISATRGVDRVRLVVDRWTAE